MSFFNVTTAKRNPGAAWSRYSKDRSKIFFGAGEVKDANIIAEVEEATEQGAVDFRHMRKCWNACQGMNPEAVQETMVFLHALPALLKDQSQHETIVTRVRELIEKAKEEET